MIQNKVISEEQTKLYLYCFDFLFEQILYILIMSILGILCRRLNITIIFLLTFLPLRIFGGGIHAPTEKSCTVLSFIIYATILFVSPIITSKHSTLCFLSIMIAPVDTANKRLSQKQKHQRKKCYSLLCLILSVFFLFFYYTKKQLYYGTLTICVILVFISMILGELVNRNTCRKNTLIF